MSEPPAIPVTRPFLPPFEEFVELMRGVWERKMLTNQGPLTLEFERRLRALHGIEMPVFAVANGGLGLQLILKALGVRGEVITTPFSYVATTSCPLWEGCTVRFADIEPEFLTLDPVAVEASITPRTEAILATHVYGNPCDVDGLERVAQRHGLALIFDAAHAFGVRYRGRSILEWGDASMVSLHATKIVHSAEGGFVVARDPAVSARLEWMRRFGHDGTEHFHGVGINAKLSELHAAMGLAVLPHWEPIRLHRRAICAAYDRGIEPLAPAIQPVPLRPGTEPNFAYYPVRFDSEDRLLMALSRLVAQSIVPRRYFHPSLDGLFANATGATPVATEAASRLLCLPLAADYEVELADRVITHLPEVLR